MPAQNPRWEVSAGRTARTSLAGQVAAARTERAGQAGTLVVQELPEPASDVLAAGRMVGRTVQERPEQAEQEGEERARQNLAEAASEELAQCHFPALEVLARQRC